MFDEKIREQCQICGSINHIYVESFAMAWQCWCCFNNWWINDDQRSIYALTNKITHEEGDMKLIEGDKNIHFVNGEYGV